MSEQKELILRLEAKKKEFQIKLASVENDVASSAKKNKLELENKIKEMTVDLKKANEDFSEAVSKKINDWLS